MKRKKLFAVVLLVVAFGMLVGCATTSGVLTPLTPLPKDINIIPPNSNVGNIGKLSGVWVGNWDDSFFQDATIILEKIDRKEVVAVYSFGDTSSFKGNWTRVLGKIKNGSIVLEWGSGKNSKTITLTPTPIGDQIQAEWRGGGRMVRALLTKVPAVPKLP